MWKLRDLTLEGKVLLIKSLGILQVLYNMHVQVFSEDQLNTLSKLLYEFLWNGKIHFISRIICETDKQEGGLKMPNLSLEYKCLRIKWIIRTLTSYLINPDRTSIALPIEYFKCLDTKYGTNLIALRVDMGMEEVSKSKIPEFYKECIKAFQELL